MFLTAVLFSLWALLLPHVQGQLCNNLPCVQNAMCNTATNKCVCNTGFVGNGRIACRPPSANRCMCSALADPLFNLFDIQTNPQSPKANLPCSVRLVGNTVYSNPLCVISNIFAHPETRGTGTGKNIRVFVKEIEVSLVQQATVTSFTVGATGLVPPTTTGVASGTQDGFNTAQVAGCKNLKIGYNQTYGGAYVDLQRNPISIVPALCGDCDNVADENAGTTNITNLAYFLRFLAPTANQKGPYSSQCGLMQSIIQSICTPAELNVAADICGRYVSPFGICLIDDAAFTAATTFTQLLTAKFIPCIQSICSNQATGVPVQCNNLQVDDTASPACQLGPKPASCP